MVTGTLTFNRAWILKRLTEVQFHKANVSFTPKCHTLQAHQVEKTGKLFMWWECVIALEKAEGNPHSLPVTEHVEDYIGFIFTYIS